MISSEREARERALETLGPLATVYGCHFELTNTPATEASPYLAHFCASKLSSLGSAKGNAKKLHALISASFNQVLDLVLEIAPFACNHLPPDLKFDNQPVFWEIMELFSELSYHAWELDSDDTSPSSDVLSPHRIYYQRKALQLIQIYLTSKTLFIELPGDIESHLAYLGVPIATSLMFVLKNMEKANLGEEQDVFCPASPSYGPSAT
ncbi:hypothetical protein DL93DRAFT_784346 [Clavulina sp. PMI_390]|nr:hypothetical protein DL93DRAFT_784346 [Clavulina sp. PMI_390]